MTITFQSKMMRLHELWLYLLVKNSTMENMSVAHKQGTSKLEENYACPIHGLTEHNQRVE